MPRQRPRRPPRSSSTACDAGHWRILIGPDAHALDVMLRERPHDAYTEAFMAELAADGHFAGLIQG